MNVTYRYSISVWFSRAQYDFTVGINFGPGLFNCYRFHRFTVKVYFDVLSADGEVNLMPAFGEKLKI